MDSSLTRRSRWIGRSIFALWPALLVAQPAQQTIEAADRALAWKDGEYSGRLHVLSRSDREPGIAYEFVMYVRGDRHRLDFRVPAGPPILRLLYLAGGQSIFARDLKRDEFLRVEGRTRFQPVLGSSFTYYDLGFSARESAYEVAMPDATTLGNELRFDLRRGGTREQGGGYSREQLVLNQEGLPIRSDLYTPGLVLERTLFYRYGRDVLFRGGGETVRLATPARYEMMDPVRQSISTLDVFAYDDRAIVREEYFTVESLRN